MFVGPGTKIGHAFGIKDQKFAYKNVISDEKPYLVTTLYMKRLDVIPTGRGTSIPEGVPHRKGYTLSG